MRVNPYHFLLLRRLIEFEVEKNLNSTPSISKIGEYILSRNGRNKLTNYWIERLRRQVLSKKDFDFDIEELNYLSKLPESVKKFDSWQDFVSVFSKSRFSANTEHYAKQRFSELKADDKQLIKSLVERKMGLLYVKMMQEGKLYGSKKKNIIFSELLRYKVAEFADIDKIANLADRVYPCPINRSDIKQNWFNRNANIFYICLDTNHELIGNINLLPLRSSCYLALKSGEIYEHQIAAEDIMASSDRELVRHIYIEGLASFSKEALYGFRNRFFKMISLMADTAQEIIIFSIGGSDEGDNIMLSHGFERTSWAVDRRSGSKYPFYEISLSRLQQIIHDKNTSIEDA